jgi:hypothetical protein
VDVTRREHRLRLICPVTRCQPPGNSLLAAAQDFRVGSFHSKCSVGWLHCLLQTQFLPTQTGISSFFFTFLSHITPKAGLVGHLFGQTIFPGRTRKSFDLIFIFILPEIPVALFAPVY